MMPTLRFPPYARPLASCSTEPPNDWVWCYLRWQRAAHANPVVCIPWDVDPNECRFDWARSRTVLIVYSQVDLLLGRLLAVAVGVTRAGARAVLSWCEDASQVYDAGPLGKRADPGFHVLLGAL
jgi:hypothetical protein